MLFQNSTVDGFIFIFHSVLRKCLIFEQVMNSQQYTSGVLCRDNLDALSPIFFPTKLRLHTQGLTVWRKTKIISFSCSRLGCKPELLWICYIYSLSYPSSFTLNRSHLKIKNQPYFIAHKLIMLINLFNFKKLITNRFINNTYLFNRNFPTKCYPLFIIRWILKNIVYKLWQLISYGSFS